LGAFGFQVQAVVSSILPRTAEAKKEEKKPEDDKKKGEEILAGLGALFG